VRFEAIPVLFRIVVSIKFSPLKSTSSFEGSMEAPLQVTLLVPGLVILLRRHDSWLKRNSQSLAIIFSYAYSLQSPFSGNLRMLSRKKIKIFLPHE
jgi:hypothetical protein